MDRFQVLRTLIRTVNLVAVFLTVVATNERFM